MTTNQPADEVREWPVEQPREGFPFVMDWDNGKSTPVRLFKLNNDETMSLARVQDIEKYVSATVLGVLDEIETIMCESPSDLGDRVDQLSTLWKGEK